MLWFCTKKRSFHRRRFGCSFISDPWNPSAESTSSSRAPNGDCDQSPCSGDGLGSIRDSPAGGGPDEPQNVDLRYDAGEEGPLEKHGPRGDPVWKDVGGWSCCSCC